MAGTRERLSVYTIDTLRFLGLSLARGTALFFGAYSLANAVATFRTPGASADIWWVDTRFLPAWFSAGFACGAAILLLAYGVAPRMHPWRRVSTALACAALAAVALHNVLGFYQSWNAGAFSPAVPFPLSLVIAISFALVALAAWKLTPRKRRGALQTMATLGFTLAMALLFPLAQIAFYGTSDYRATADVAVVFGAKVTADGTPSTSLRHRLNTAVELYRTGSVKRLLMSGGVGESGVDEAVAMKAAAVSAGVPASAILLDHEGVDTDATVANTMGQFDDIGAKRVIAVSQFYHLPRIKLAYLAEGLDVRTVPATGNDFIVQTPRYVLREVPAFWLYWMRAFVRDVRPAA